MAIGSDSMRSVSEWIKTDLIHSTAPVICKQQKNEMQTKNEEKKTTNSMECVRSKNHWLQLSVWISFHVDACTEFTETNSFRSTNKSLGHQPQNRLHFIRFPFLSLSRLHSLWLRCQEWFGFSAVYFCSNFIVLSFIDCIRLRYVCCWRSPVNWETQSICNWSMLMRCLW